MKKKSFTLIEILISISLFSLIVLFLYKALDMTTKSNKFYHSKLEIEQNNNSIKKIIFIDLINRTTKDINIWEDKNKNSIITFKTLSNYHNPFYQNITYLISKNNNLIRIQSKTKIDKKLQINSTFLDNCYIDIFESNISIFKISHNKTDKKISFYIQKKNKEKILFGF